MVRSYRHVFSFSWHCFSRMGINRATGMGWWKGSKQRKTQDLKRFDQNWMRYSARKIRSAVDDCYTVTQEGFAKKNDIKSSSQTLTREKCNME